MNTDLKITVPPEITCRFEAAGGIILVKALLNGKKRNFFVDSGAPSLTLNIAHLQSDQLQDGHVDFQGVGGAARGGRIRIRSFTWEKFTIRNKLVNALDLSHLEHELDMQIHGLIGHQELAHFTMKIDYKQQELQLWREFNAQDYTILAQIPFVLHNHIPIFSAKVDKRQLKLGLDTGAAVNLLDANLLKHIPSFEAAKKEEQLHGAGSKSLSVPYGRLPQTTISNTEFKNMRVVWSDIRSIKQVLGEMDGLLGYEFLKKRQMAVSFPDNRIYLIRKKRSKTQSR